MTIFKPTVFFSAVRPHGRNYGDITSVFQLKNRQRKRPKKMSAQLDTVKGPCTPEDP